MDLSGTAWGFCGIYEFVGNIIGFIPFGVLVPVIFQEFRDGGLIVLSGFGLSLLVETIQLVTKVGSFDVDDMMLNTLGAFLGYVIFKICDKMRRKYYGKEV